jgi:ribonucleoside-diphosphate reductase alpha subunit
MSKDEIITVITRSGKREIINPNKILERLNVLIGRPPTINHVHPYNLMLEVIQRIRNNISTTEIDDMTANYAASKSITNPYYMQLATRIIVDNHQKNTSTCFFDKMEKAYHRTVVYPDILSNTGSYTKTKPLISSEYYEYVKLHKDYIESIIDYSRDYLIEYFGFKTFLMLYGLKIENVVIERPQDTFMRVAIAINMNTKHSIEEELLLIKNLYDQFSLKKLTNGSPTLFNAGTPHPQYASCFLLGTEDSVDGIMHTNNSIATISRYGGGIGLHINNWRSTGSYIRGTGGISNGIVPFLQMYNANIKAISQGKRNGSAAIYLSLHHADILQFLKLKLPSGLDNERARDLHYGVWVSDLFMQRVKDNAVWSLFNPDTVGDLAELYDDKKTNLYSRRYLELEERKLFTEQIPARELWKAIFESNKIKGTPYICFSDVCNYMSNQKNLGTIKSSNLCTEIILYSNGSTDDKGEYAVCNLSSINLTICVKDRSTLESGQKYTTIEGGQKYTTIEGKQTDTTKETTEDKQFLDDYPLDPVFDFNQLIATVKLAVINLNNIIDKTFYPTIETKRSNLRHRPIGIGVQGLADVYAKMRIPFDSFEARQLNKKISETIYYASMTQSTHLAKEMYKHIKTHLKTGGTYTIPTYSLDNFHSIKTFTEADDIPKDIGAYPSYKWVGGIHANKAPISEGIFHWELYGLTIKDLNSNIYGQNYDWETLREHIKTFGIRNSQVVALMPTASTSQLLSNNECTEPYTSNVYKRKTLAGEFVIINRWLTHDLFKMGIWSDKIKDMIIALDGSVQLIEEIPQQIKNLYKTAWEIGPDELIQQAIDRQPFVDQAQSLNWFIEDLNYGQFTKLAFKAWNGKLKTCKYYVHTRPSSGAQKFTIDPLLQEEMIKRMASEKLSNMAEKETICESCSS